jgi:hypothetical protein
MISPAKRLIMAWMIAMAAGLTLLPLHNPALASDDAKTFCSKMATSKDLPESKCESLYNEGSGANDTQLKAFINDCSNIGSVGDTVACVSIVNGGNQHATDPTNVTSVGGGGGAPTTPANPSTPAGSADCPSSGCLNASQLKIPTVSVGSGLNTIIDIASFLAGILSVVFLILGGIRYITSEGSPQNLASAKQTITYAVIGLIISILAPLIIGFVIASGPK